MKAILLTIAATCLLGSSAFAGQAPAPGPLSSPAGSVIVNTSLAKAISRAGSSNSGRTIITVSPQVIATLNALAANPPAGASVTTSGAVTTLLNVTLLINGEAVKVDISFDSDSKQVTITKA